MSIRRKSKECARTHVTDRISPLRKEIIPIWAAALLAALVPITVFLICQIRVRSFWDVNNATIGLLYSLIGAAVFQVFVKWLIGGLRPHFLAVCKPDPALVLAAQGAGDGFKSIYFQPDICTGDKAEINDALESMPSGHTTAAFAGFVFLYLYLNAKLKVFSTYHPAMWKLIAIYAPILGAVLIGGALTIDEFHNWYDVFAGAAIGTVFAFSSYRMVYAAIWDFRYNHIPLNRGSPFMYGHGHGSELSNAVFTRKGGFGGHGHGLSGHHEKGVAAGHHNGHHHNGIAHQDGLHNGHTRNLSGGTHTYNDSSIPRRPVGAHTDADHMV